MSDIEEPAAKVSKLDETHLAEGEEEMEEGQEEWLSEEILTDEDYAAGDHEHIDHANLSQDEGNNDSMEQVIQNTSDQLQETITEENIEQTLNNFENSRSNDQGDLPEELGAFLVRKTDDTAAVKLEKDKEPESDLDESVKQSEDDGNDTDDLLRMLGEDSSKKKEIPTAQPKKPKETQHSSDEDDDDYIFEGAKVTRLKMSKDLKKQEMKRLKVAKSAVLQKRVVASKAVPEDLSDRDADNEISSSMSPFAAAKAMARKTVTKMMGTGELSDAGEDSVPKISRTAVMERGTSSDEALTVKRMFGVRGGRGRRGINALKTVTKRVVSIDKGNAAAPSTTALPSVTISKQVVVKPPSRVQPHHQQAAKQEAVQHEMEEEEHLEEEFSRDMHSDGELSDEQQLMRPERMDEEVPSDAESHSDADSSYDELPSSESEDAEEWFTLDLRAERAAEYIPMLGPNARQLLLAEEDRARARLESLRESAHSLCEGRRALSSQLRLARQALAHLDAALTAQ